MQGREKKCFFWKVDECTMLETSHGICTPLTDDVLIDSTSDTDDINVISTQILHLEIPVASTVGINSLKETPEEESRRKRVNRIVGFFASLIFVTCVALVCSSLMMSKNIDELVRQSNVLLRRPAQPRTTTIRPPLHLLDIISSTIE